MKKIVKEALSCTPAPVGRRTLDAPNLVKDLPMTSDPILSRGVRAGACLGLVLALAACSSTAVRVGGAPEISVRNCVAAATREFKVGSEAVAVMSSSTPRDGVYAINLAVGPQKRSAVCTADENGAVLGLVYKRPE